ncbi:RNA-binding protein MEX3B [Ambystoma mexicanum]|uniref:RNA-binding protein MEX3B n=1 Tax=Ambystoma mexicanum TaxID=8296 RepID=UPI0037E77C0A
MPSSLYAEVERGVISGGGGDSLEEQRAFQIALDQLSLLGLDSDDSSGSIYDNEPRKKSINMTECVPVPSSEHVAEIVGRQGCKIKALRAKTNTYIKTPVRGEEPIFVVTGRKEDVALARREIISAAEHFSMIRASRNKNVALNGGTGVGSSGAGSGTVPGPPNLPGQTTIQVRVPYRVVGLVVGPKGATIKRIQQQTHTYIVTPSRDKEPVFEVTGMPENVDRAREEIEAHIAVRTGGVIELQDENDFHANGTDVGLELHAHACLWGTKSGAGRRVLSSYRHDSSSSLGSASSDSYYGGSSSSSGRTGAYSPPSPTLSFTHNGNNNNNVSTSAYVYDLVSPDGVDAAFDSNHFDPAPAAPSPATTLIWSQLERAAASSASTGCHIGASPPGGGLAHSASLNANHILAAVHQRRAALRHSPPPGGHVTGLADHHPLARRVRSDPPAYPTYVTLQQALNASNLSSSSHLLTGGGGSCDSSASSTSSQSSSSSSSSSSSCSMRRKGSRDCSVCCESEVIAALVPCGHNLFCMECANRICERSEPQCPACHSLVTQAIRIFS